MWENTVAIYSVLKKKNYKTKFSTNSILKKIKSTKTIPKKKHKKKKKKEKRRRQFWKKKKQNKMKKIEKNMWGNTVTKQKPCGETL
jgi:hypothetical protein